jgi:hypothetical protein
MRIVHVINKKVPPCGDQGGAPQSVSWLADEQVKQGHDVYVMSTGGKENTLYKNIKIDKDLPVSQAIEFVPFGIDIVTCMSVGETLKKS